MDNNGAADKQRQKAEVDKKWHRNERLMRWRMGGSGVMSDESPRASTLADKRQRAPPSGDGVKSRRLRVEGKRCDGVIRGSTTRGDRNK